MMIQKATEAPGLITDIGGTNARLALATPDGRSEAERIPSGADYPDLVREAEAYLVITAANPASRGAVAALD